MTTLYDDMQEIASQLLTKFQQGAIAYVRMTPVAGATPDAPAASTAASTVVNAVVRGVQYKFVQRGMAVATDLQVTIAGDALASEPSMLDFVDIDGVRHKIVQIVRRPAAGTVVVWTLIVRK